MKTITKFSLTILVASVISACGSGGDGANVNHNNTPTNAIGSYIGVKDNKIAQNAVISNSNDELLVGEFIIPLTQLKLNPDENSYTYENDKFLVLALNSGNKHSNIGLLTSPLDKSDNLAFLYYFTYGTPTQLSDIPKSGTINYTGTFFHNFDDLEPEVNATYIANFDDKTLTGQLNGYDGKTFILNTKIEGNAFTGQATSSSYNQIGDVKGQFYGPNAEELAGIINASKEQNNESWMAAFVGRRQN